MEMEFIFATLQILLYLYSQSRISDILKIRCLQTKPWSYIPLIAALQDTLKCY